jgi:hypothetical protein
LTSKVFDDIIDLSNERSITIMQTTIYKGFTITLSDEDTKKLDKAWKDACKHWRCIVYDKANRKQMGFDVFGGSHATMKPLEALYLFCDDAYTYTCFDDVDVVLSACIPAVPRAFHSLSLSKKGSNVSVIDL